MIFAVAAVVVLLAAVLLYYYFSFQRNDVHRRLAELNLDAPVESVTSVAIHKLLDDSQQRSLARRLNEAGWYNMKPVKMMGFMLVGTAGGAGLGLLLGIALGEFDVRAVFIFAVMTVCGFMFPNAMIERAIAARKRSIQRELPNLLDMISTSVEAGTALSQALTIGLDAVTGPLKEELMLVNDDIRLGRSRQEALAAMAHRVREPDLTTCVTAIVQAERLGGNIANVLTSLSTEARERRTLRAEEIAAALPVKMVFPMALFMLPALVLIIFGSVAAQYFK